jgi:predicted permease
MNWWQRLTNRRRLDHELEKELRFHLDQHTSDLIAQGHAPGDARRMAALALGGRAQVDEYCRDARGTRWLEDFAMDLRHSLRTLKRHPGFTGVVLATLALGIGASTVMFAVVNGVLLSPLPYPDPGRLVSLYEQTDWSSQYGNRWSFSYPNYLDSRGSGGLDLAAWRFTGGTLSEPGDAEYIEGREVSANLMPTLGTNLRLGRTFSDAEDAPGGTPVAIISDELWQRHFGRNPTALGQRVVFEGLPRTVIGIAAAGVRVAGQADIFLPLGQNPEPRLRNRDAHGVQVWGRLRPGATEAVAQSELTVIGSRLAAQYPASNRGRTLIVEPLRPNVGAVRSTLWLLFGAVNIVLLVACANVASLLLARAISRDRELAMRAALGAGRGRLIRQCLTESAVLGVAGGALGVAFAAAGMRPFIAFWPGALPRASQVQLDPRVLAFALAASLVSGMLFGLAPALRSSTRNLEARLRLGPRTLGGSTRRLHGSFVVAEIALAVVLLVSAGILGRTLLRLWSLSTGVNTSNVLVTRVALSPAAMTTPERMRAAWRDVVSRARQVPGVQAVALVDTVPMRSGNNQLGWATSPAIPPPDRQPLALATTVTPGYIGTMGLQLRDGRFIADEDRFDTIPVVVIDEVFARQAFGGARAVGRQLWFPQMQREPFEVVGVVDHVRHWGLASDDQARVRAQFYYSFAQVPDVLVRRWSQLMSMAVRTAVPPLSIVEPLRHELRKAATDQVLYEVRTLDDLANGTVAAQRFLLVVFGVFAGLALVLASIGIYGVLAYLTNQRVPEFGVRMALGATRRDVMQLVLRQSLGMLVIGTAVGTAAAFGAARVLQQYVEGVQTMELSTVAAMTGVLIAAGLLATLVPALRAARVDAINALREG